MTVVIGEHIRVTISYNIIEGSIAQNVFYFLVSGDDIADDDLVDDLQTALEGAFLLNWQNLASDQNDAFLMEVDVINLDGTIDRNVGSNGLVWPGDNVSQSLPAAVAGFIQVDSSGSKALGRKYVPGAGEDMTADGAFTSAAVVFLAAMLINYLAAIPVGVSTILLPGVISKATMIWNGFIGSGYTIDVPAYQRRRKPNVGS